MSTTAPKRPTKTAQQNARVQAARTAARKRLAIRVLIGAVAVGALLYGLFRTHSGPAASGKSPSSRYGVGQPGAGAQAPPLRLSSIKGGQFDLAAEKGKTVMLYFQEGVGCEPCWTQIRDIEANDAKFKALGIDELVSITGNDLGALRQKAADEHLNTPVLADPGLAVSKTYHANDFGMMGTGADGHTFIVVGPDGTIRWRADYGGAPNYTMYVSIDQLTADLRAGLTKA